MATHLNDTGPRPCDHCGREFTPRRLSCASRRGYRLDWRCPWCGHRNASPGEWIKHGNAQARRRRCGMNTERWAAWELRACRAVWRWCLGRGMTPRQAAAWIAARLRGGGVRSADSVYRRLQMLPRR